MPELIDRQAALEIAMSYCPDDDGCCSKAGHDIREMLDEIEALPTIEAEPVRHGRWKCLGEYEEFSEEMADYLCESCGYVISRLKNQKPKFCEGCGAQMDATDTNVGGKGGADNGNG